MLQFWAKLMIVIYDPSLGYDLAMIVYYNHNHSFIVLATVIKNVNYDGKTFIVQATGGDRFSR